MGAGVIVLLEPVIDDDLGWPDAMQRAFQRQRMGTVTKVAFRFPEATWDADTQYFGWIGPHPGCWAYVVNYETFSDTLVLMPLSFGAEAFEVEAMSEADIVADALAALRNLMGSDLPDPLDWRSTRWSQNRLTRGAYSFPKAGSGWKTGIFGRSGVAKCCFLLASTRHGTTTERPMAHGLAGYALLRPCWTTFVSTDHRTSLQLTRNKRHPLAKRKWDSDRGT